MDEIRAAGEIPSYLAPTAALVIAAAVVGYISVRVKVVPIVGFLLAGVAIGPSQLGLVSNSEAVTSAADVGVILLLFTIGIEFSLDRLARVWRWIVFGGGTQVLLATALTLGVVAILGESWKVGVFTGFLVALSSTAIVLKLIDANGETNTTRGRLSLSVLIFQDLAVVAMVLLVPLLGTESDGGTGELLEALGIAVAMIVGVLVIARKVMPPVLEKVAAACSPEVFLLSVIAICFGTAYATALAGVSVSLGAFLAGLVVSESEHSTHAFSEVLPLQIIFSAVFFVSVGMLLDVGFLLSNLPVVIGVAALILVAKTATTTISLLPLGVGWRQAVGSGLMLGQVGEFSFVLLTAGAAEGLTPGGFGEDGTQAFVATTVLLMILTPMLSSLGKRVIDATPRASGNISQRHEGVEPADADAPPVVILGWGDASIEVGRDALALGVPAVMTTLNPAGAEAAGRAGITVVRGDSTRAQVLDHAGIAGARLVVIAEDDPEQAIRVTLAARTATTAPIVVRALDEMELDELADAGADHVITGPTATAHHLRSAVGGLLPPKPGIAGSASRTVVDTSKLRRLSLPDDAGCSHAEAVGSVVADAVGCAECLRTGGRWVHLRMCAGCGYVGCCDSSPGRHARAHFEADDHPVMVSVEPNETWGYCFVEDVTFEATDTTTRSR